MAIISTALVGCGDNSTDGNNEKAKITTDIVNQETDIETTTKANVSEDITTKDVSNEDMTTADVSNEDMTTADVSNKDMTTADISNEDVSQETTETETTSNRQTVTNSTTKENITKETTTKIGSQNPTEETTTYDTSDFPDDVDDEKYMKEIDVKWNEGYIDKDGKIVAGNANYVYSDLIELTENDVIQYRATGSTEISLLVLYNKHGEFEKVIQPGGKWHVIDRYYYANKNCYVRISKRQTDNKQVNCYEAVDAKTYILDKAYLMSNKLYGKTMVVIGDSMIYGDIIGNEITWINQLGMKYNMTIYNYGINGNTISTVGYSIGVPMCERYKTISEEVKNADIIIVEGGANDKSNDCPIGENDDTTNNTFKGALNNLIDGLKEKYPDKTILFMTCYERHRRRNEIGLRESAYANAMKEICELKGIPCFDNFNESGISFVDEEVVKWADEGLYLESVGQMNTHLSPAAYTHLAKIYDKWIGKFLK